MQRLVARSRFRTIKSERRRVSYENGSASGPFSAKENPIIVKSNAEEEITPLRKSWSELRLSLSFLTLFHGPNVVSDNLIPIRHYVVSEVLTIGAGVECVVKRSVAELKALKVANVRTVRVNRFPLKHDKGAIFKAYRF